MNAEKNALKKIPVAAELTSKRHYVSGETREADSPARRGFDYDEPYAGKEIRLKTGKER